jgi:hypothetical protein
MRVDCFTETMVDHSSGEGLEVNSVAIPRPALNPGCTEAY